jgi:MSHA pilin protein MshD
MVAVYATTTRSSVDPVLVQQMQAIADNMMEEILMKPFAQGPGAGARVNFDDVRDYNGYNTTGIRDVEGNMIPGLERYAVTVEAIPAALTGVATTGDALRVTVTVSVPGNDPSYPKPIVLTGWRTNPS